MSRGVLIAFATPVRGREEEFDRWYDNVHIPDVLSVDGILTAKKARLSAAQMPAFQSAVAEFRHQNVIIYEVEDEDPQAALLRLTEAALQFEESEAMDYESLSAIYFDELITTTKDRSAK